LQTAENLKPQQLVGKLLRGFEQLGETAMMLLHLIRQSTHDESTVGDGRNNH
jgi:hypothetical protein